VDRPVYIIHIYCCLVTFSRATIRCGLPAGLHDFAIISITLAASVYEIIIIYKVICISMDRNGTRPRHNARSSESVYRSPHNNRRLNCIISALYYCYYCCYCCYCYNIVDGHRGIIIVSCPSARVSRRSPFFHPLCLA